MGFLRWTLRRQHGQCTRPCDERAIPCEERSSSREERRTAAVSGRPAVGEALRGSWVRPGQRRGSGERACRVAV